MEENKKNRVALDDDMLEKVTGGTLKLFAKSSGSSVRQYDVDMNCIGVYEVADENVYNIYTFLTTQYWDLEVGRRDEQALDYMRAQGWI